MPKKTDEPTRERPPQIRARTPVDRFKAAQLVANILAPFPPTVRTAILAMALAGDVDRQSELPLGRA